MESKFGFVAYFVYAFTSIFAIVNPVGGLMTFIALTQGMSEAERTRAARRSVATACALAVLFALAGEFILRFFNVTADNLRVAGGVLLMLVAVDMMHARTSRESVTPEELRDAALKEDVSIFPLATPLLTGPGAITTVILVIRTGRTVEHKLIALLAIVLTFAVSYLLFRFSNRLSRILGMTVSLVVTRIMGLLLGAIAVNFIAVGIWNIYRSFQ